MSVYVTVLVFIFTMAVKKKTPEEATFEEALAQLESIVDSMEEGDIALNDLVAKYEEGTRYLRACQHRLKDAELKIEKLKNEQGETEPFEPGVSQ